MNGKAAGKEGHTSLKVTCSSRLLVHGEMTNGQSHDVTILPQSPYIIQVPAVEKDYLFPMKHGPSLCLLIAGLLARYSSSVISRQ